MGNLYDQDFYAWTKAQAEALKRGDFSQADVKNIIEEIETMGRGEKRELLSRLEVLLTHLLTWNNQFLLRSKSWVPARVKVDVASFMPPVAFYPLLAS